MPKDEITEEEAASGEVKGPDPKVWGNDDDRPSPIPEADATVVDGVEVKGPDPEVWGGDDD